MRLIDKKVIVGAVKVNKPWTYHKNNYECAAWWEDQQAVPGVYPIYMGFAYLSPHELELTAHIKALVTDDYFPGLWGGVPISREPYKCKNVGEERLLHHGIGIDEAIQRTGNSPGNDLDIFFHRDWWAMVEDEAAFKVEYYRKYVDKTWSEYAALNRETFIPSLEGRHDFHAEYQSKLSSVAHAGERMAKWARRLTELSRYRGYRGQDGRHPIIPKDMYYSNVSWANAIFIPPFDKSLFKP